MRSKSLKSPPLLSQYEAPLVPNCFLVPLFVHCFCSLVLFSLDTCTLAFRGGMPFATPLFFSCRLFSCRVQGVPRVRISKNGSQTAFPLFSWMHFFFVHTDVLFRFVVISLFVSVYSYLLMYTPLISSNWNFLPSDPSPPLWVLLLVQNPPLFFRVDSGEFWFQHRPGACHFFFQLCLTIFYSPLVSKTLYLSLASPFSCEPSFSPEPGDLSGHSFPFS